MLRDRDIVCISSVPWDYLMISPQQTMRVLARHNRVLFIDRQTSLAALVTDLKEFGRWRQCFFQGIREVERNLFAVAPHLAVPFTARSLVPNRMSMAVLGAFVRRAMRRLGFAKPIVWHYLPAGAFLLGKLGEAHNVYEIIDDHESFSGVNAPVMQAMELQLLEKADVVVAISRNLARKKGGPGRTPAVVPIGAEIEHFSKSRSCAELPQDIREIKRPVVGYYGGIDERINTRLVSSAAAAFPDVQFVFIGPVKRESVSQELGAVSNIHFFGPKSYGEIPSYLAGFDVSILPYRISEFTRNIYPNKIFEYLASGKPVVASDLPALQGMEGSGVFICSSEEAFISGLHEALHDDDRDLYRARIALAEQNSWEKRVERICELIEKKCL